MGLPVLVGSCTACGDCCDPVWYPLGPADLRQSASTTGAADLVFATAHWHATGEQTADGMHAYSCDRFDAVSRLCTAHDERPPICRAYPQPENLLPLRCGFRATEEVLRSTGCAIPPDPDASAVYCW